ncbi:MAG: DMT family protein [Acidobacteriota bacterium]|nr:DMT family protein [Acidobacteriota bacterium]
MWTILLLICSNIFMTIAWYGHLKFESQPLWKVIVVSWMIAFLEYCFQVPANRIGYGRFTPVQLKVIQEVITITVFAVFTTFYFGSHLKWNHAVSGVMLIGAVFFAFHTF